MDDITNKSNGIIGFSFLGSMPQLFKKKGGDSASNEKWANLEDDLKEEKVVLQRIFGKKQP